jgi:hypothetical protein
VVDGNSETMWLGWWKEWATVCDLERHSFVERRGCRFMNRDHIDHHRRLRNQAVALGSIYTQLGAQPFHYPCLPFPIFFPTQFSIDGAR